MELFTEAESLVEMFKLNVHGKLGGYICCNNVQSWEHVQGKIRGMELVCGCV